MLVSFTSSVVLEISDRVLFLDFIVSIYVITFVSAEILLFSEHVEEELLAGAALHAGGVSLVEQDCGHPGQYERHPAGQHDHPHLVFVKFEKYKC